MAKVYFTFKDCHPFSQMYCVVDTNCDLPDTKKIFEKLFGKNYKMASNDKNKVVSKGCQCALYLKGNKFGLVETSENLKILENIINVTSHKKPQYNHVYDLAFSINSSSSTAEDVNTSLVLKALQKRIVDLIDEDLFMDAVDGPFDSHEIV
ncbi:MAG: hypothetical protein COA43_00525 [Robiginitomaculum sp.]|nr:MAG: hypothetical protein COA43_00525 [Robiginitomaculum sp.]